MDDNLSMKSSESLTTSSEYETVTESNVTTPIESQLQAITPPVKEVSDVTSAISKSPTLDIANNRDLSDLQKEMTETIRELELEKDIINTVQIQRLEQDITTLSDSLGTLMKTVSKCKQCSAHIDVGVNADTERNEQECNKDTNEALLGPLYPLNGALQRVRELDLELAKAKLAQVEVECQNQDLNHQLSTAINEMQTNRNSWEQRGCRKRSTHCKKN